MSELPLATRLSDRVNPILLREIQQALRGRTFGVTLLLSLAAISIAAMIVAQDAASARAGQNCFDLALAFLAPIAFFIVPFQAFLSTRQEVGAGTAEHLLLTRLSPGAIVRGKLLASGVQFLLYLSLFSPLLALSYLLTGVDVPLIAITIGAAFVVSLGATTYAVALGAGSATQYTRAVPYGFAALTLGLFTVLVMFNVEDLRRAISYLVRRDQLGTVLGIIGFPFVLLMLLCGMGATSFLAHPYENRSTPFRLLAILGLLGGFVWGVLVAPTSSVDEVAIGIGFGSCVVGVFFWLFAVTEDERLSPRVRTRVPRRAWLAVLSIPFLPGASRGFLFALILAGLAAGGSLLLPELFGNRSIHGYVSRQIAAAWLYVVIYAGLGRIVRSLLPAGRRGTWLARLVVPGSILAICIVPLLLSVLFSGRIMDWSLFYIGNPVFAITRDPSDLKAIVAMLAFGASFIAVANVGAVVAGAREVMECSAERRRAS